MLKKIFIICLTCSISFPALAQLQADIQTPKIVPPSPDAASLGKYGAIPVDKSTGIPQISIPLYEIKTPRFSLPISLSYHASGIKVEEISSWVGAGWSLNSGGVITRSILGRPDDAPLGFVNQTVKKAANIQWPADISYIADVLNKRVDTDPDNFFYNFSTQAGSFVFGEDKKPVVTPYKPIKVNFNSSSKNFDITDEQGNIYNFTDKEYVQSSTPSMSGISSWYLTQMISADLTDTIKFVYTIDATPLLQFSFNFSQSITSADGTAPNSLQQLITSPSNSQFNCVRISSILFKGGKVDFIAKAGRLDDGIMSLDSVRISNLNLASGQFTCIKSFKLLQDYYYSTVAIPTGFSVTITEADKHRLRLIGLRENDATNAAVKTYQFDYSPASLPQVHCFAQDYWGYYNGKWANQTLLESRQVTYWSGSQQQVASIGGSQGADRSVSETDMQAGILQKITYPTKGYTSFSYECNKRLDITYTQQGFTVAAIGAQNQGGTLELNSQTYTPTASMLNSGGNVFNVNLNTGNTPSGSVLPYVKVVRVSDGATIYNSATNGSANTQITNLVLPLVANVQYAITAEAHGTSGPPSSQSSSAVIYTRYTVPSGGSLIKMGGLRVKSIQDYNSDGTIAKTETYYYGNNDESGGGVQLAFYPVYHLSQGNYHTVGCNFFMVNNETYTNNSVYPLANFNGSPVAYPTVKIYYGDSLQNIGKSIFKYNTYPDSPLVTSSYSGYGNGVKPISVSWKNGEPISEEHYRNIGNNQYSLVQAAYNTYSIIGRKGGVGTTIGYNAEPIGFNFDIPYIRTDGNVGASGPCGGVIWLQNQFYWYDYPISTGSRVLSQTITNNYAPDGVTKVSTTTNYYYDNLNHVFPTRIENITSTIDSRRKKINYPQDMVLAGKDPTGIYNSMVTANIVSPSIEVTDSLNTTQLLRTTNSYALFNGSLKEPQSIMVQNKSNTAETRLQYLSYDTKGNLQTVTKDDGPKVCYQWGYNGQYPVAMATNATGNDIFYEGFEDGKGNSLADDSRTGHYSHTGAFSKALTGLDNGSYILTYWQKSGVTWTLVTTTVTVSAANYAISLSAQIDDVSFYPTTAQMTTYTYDPLIGVTSQTDPNNRTIFYQYDAFNRLIVIRDKDNNVLKKICYNYAGQPESCTLPTFFNVSKSGPYTRNNCTTGTGTSVTYTVPAGTYTSLVSQADADQKAQNDIYNNGQAYANTNGNCVVTGSFAMSSGYISTYATISSINGGNVSFNLVFYPTSTMFMGTEYMIASISTNCRPVTNKTMTLFYAGRSFLVTIYASSGLIGVRTISGGDVPAFTSINLVGNYVQTN